MILAVDDIIHYTKVHIDDNGGDNKYQDVDVDDEKDNVSSLSNSHHRDADNGRKKSKVKIEET